MSIPDLYFETLVERDHQYTARDTVPDFMQFVREYTRLSDLAKQYLPYVAELAYGDSTAEYLDVFPVEGKQAAPLLVFIHGGYWRALSKNESAFMAPVFTEAGVAVAALDYALAPQVNLETIVTQCRKAIAYLFHHASDLGIDPTRIHIAGSSAGAHLCGMLLASGWQTAFGVPVDVIRSATLLSGLFDIRPLCETHINQWLQLTPQRAAAMSPLANLPQYPCDVLCSVGTLERAGFQNQTRAYLQALTVTPCATRNQPGEACHHFDLPLQLTQADSPLTQAVLAMIG